MRRLSSSPMNEARARHFALEPPLDARHGEADLRLKTEGTHALGNERCGLDLVEASLGVMKDRLTELDDLVAMAIDRIAYRALQLVLACHCHPRNLAYERLRPHQPVAALIALTTAMYRSRRLVG
jgi:hypothetical protein